MTRTSISSHLSSQRLLRSQRFWRLQHGLLSQNVRAIRRLRLPKRFTGLTSGKCTEDSRARPLLFPPPAFRERRHRRFACCLVAVGRLRYSWWPKASVHIHGVPTGAACTLESAVSAPRFSCAATIRPRAQ